MAVVRSSGRARVSPPQTDVSDEEAGDDLDDDWSGWRWPEPEVREYEDSLPDPDVDWWPLDEYEEQWYRIPGRLLGTEADDSAAWEHQVRLPCERCGQQDDLDPLGTCTACRSADQRCTWCGLDPIVYEIDGACRTCYQRLRRTRVTTELELRLSMLDAAVRRLDLRKRRASKSGVVMTRASAANAK